MNRAELYRQRSDAFAARGAAFAKHEGRERFRRGLVNLATAAFGAVTIGVKWPTMTLGWVIGIAAGLFVVKWMGNTLVNIWADNLIRRIEAEHPMPTDVQGPDGEP